MRHNWLLKDCCFGNFNKAESCGLLTWTDILLIMKKKIPCTVGIHEIFKKLSF